jgi:ribokinase/adenosine kinase
MGILVCGSVAYDILLDHPKRFRDQLLPDQLHKLSTTFLVPRMRREYGGCAGNIVYTLGLLGTAPILMAAVGEDFAPYRAHLQQLGVRLDLTRECPGHYTAQCFIISDVESNQLMAFHPGAMDEIVRIHLSELAVKPELAIVAPSGRAGSLQCARELAAAGVPFIFDPGQELPLFSRDELVEMIDLASYVAVNDYESELLINNSGLSLSEIAGRVQAMFVTRGAKGSDIFTPERLYSIPIAPLESALVNPAGCGDAYRAGLLLGLYHGLSLPEVGRLASLLGAIVAEHPGAQNHKLTRASLEARYRSAFGGSWPLKEWS